MTIHESKLIPESKTGRRKLRRVPFHASKGNQERRKQIVLSQIQGERLRFNQEEEATKEKGEEKEEHLEQKISSPILPTSDWVIEIKEKLYQNPKCQGLLHPWLDHCIFRVPKNLLEIEPKAYIPRLVSIGPYHRGDTSLQEVEKHKWRILRHVLDRTGHNLELLLEAMLNLEEKARRCYAKPIKHISHREFIEMMLLDACFILELLSVSVKGFIYCGYSWGDPIFTSRGVLPCIQRDLLLLENQLPLFVLDRLFALICDPCETDSMSQIALQFFDSVIPGCQNQQHMGTDSDEPGLHFLHLVRQSLIPSSKNKFACAPIKNDHPQLMMHCVTRLRDSGVKFRKKKSDNFMDIEFKNGTLHIPPLVIPPLVIHDSTKAIFLNLMVFEQCYPHCSNHVTSYMNFMDGLINCPRDVSYLRSQGIINHGLGNEEDVACLFNSICREIVFDINDCYLSGVSADVDTYFNRKWHTWRTSLRHDYFNNPWAIISFIAAMFLIGLTLAQTFYSIFTYYVPAQ